MATGPNDALIALRLEVEGLERMDKAASALDRTSQAKERMGKTPGKLVVEAEFVDRLSPGLKKSESDLTHFINVVTAKSQEYVAAMDKMAQASIRTSRQVAAAFGISANDYSQIALTTRLQNSAFQLNRLIQNPEPGVDDQEAIGRAITRINQLGPGTKGIGPGPLIPAGASTKQISDTLAKIAGPIMIAAATARYGAAVRAVGPVTGAISIAKLLSTPQQIVSSTGEVDERSILQAIKTARLKEFGPANTKEFETRVLAQLRSGAYSPESPHIPFDTKARDLVLRAAGPNVARQAPLTPLLGVLASAPAVAVETTGRVVGPQLTIDEINAMNEAVAAKARKLRASGVGRKFAQFEENLPVEKMYSGGVKPGLGESGFIDPRLFNPFAWAQALRARAAGAFNFGNWAGVAPSSSFVGYTSPPFTGRGSIFGGIGAASVGGSGVPPIGGPPPGVVPGGPIGAAGGGLGPTGPITGPFSSLSRFGSRFAGLGYYAAAAAIIYPVASATATAFKTATDLEVIMRRIQGIYGTHTLGEQLAIKQEVFSTAQRYSERIEEVARTAQLFAQEQTSLKDLPAQLNAAAVGAKAFGLEMSDVAGYIIRVQNATGGRVQGGQAVDLISSLAARGAVSPQNIMTAIEQLSPMLEQFTPAAGPLDEQAIIGAMASYNSSYGGITGSQLSNAMKFMISRFGSLDATRSIQRISGVELGTAESEGENLRPFINIMTDLAAAYNKLLDTGQSGKASELLRVLFSTRQTGPGNIILKYWTDELERANIAIADHGAAARQAELQQNAWASSIVRLQNSLAGFAGTISTTVKPSIGVLVNTFTDLLNLLNKGTLDIESWGQTRVGSSPFALLGAMISPVFPILGATLGATSFSRPNITPAISVAELGDYSSLGLTPFTTKAPSGSLFSFGTPAPKPKLFSEAPTSKKPIDDTAFLFIKDIRETARATELTAQSQFERGLAASNLSTIRSFRQADIRALDRRDPDASPEVRLSRALQLINLEKVESEGQITLQQQNQIEDIRTQILLKNHVATLDGDLKQKADEASEVEIASEIKKLNIHIELERRQLDNRVLLQKHEAEINAELEKQAENLKKINEVATLLNNTLLHGARQFPATLAQQRQGGPGNILAAIASSFIVPFGTGLFGQGIKGAEIFGQHGIGSGITKYIQSRFNPNLASEPDLFKGSEESRPIQQYVLGGNVGNFTGEAALRSIDPTKEGALTGKEKRDAAKRQAALAASLFIGSAAGSAIGGHSQGAETGASIGALVGSALPIPGGTFIGAIAGGIIGGFIGGKPKEPPQVNHLEIIADNSREQVRLLENTNYLLATNLVSFNVPTGFRLPSYQPNLFGGGRSGSINNTAINVSVQLGGSNVNTNQVGTAIAQAISDRLELESRSSGLYSPRLIYG